MAWTAPMTAAYGAVLTAAQWNTHIRDNSNETMPGKATAAGRWFVSTGANAIAERTITEQLTAAAEATSSTSYVDLTTVGPAITATTGTRALVFLSSRMANSTDNADTWASVAVSGATTLAASDTWGLNLEGAETSNQNMYGVFHYFNNLTAGSNTFTMKYRVGSGTGTFTNRRICVVAM